MARSRSDSRCDRCRMHLPLCICALIPRLELGTRVILLMHAREVERSTNTGRLAALSLVDSEIRIRGDLRNEMSREGLVASERQALFLFPSEDAVDLTPAFVAGLRRPFTLIVPDGTWRQAFKVAQREPILAGVPQVRVPRCGKPSEYLLRQGPNADSLSTFEAVARSLGVLEGAPVQEELEKIFGIMIDRTLWSRGRLHKDQCRGGVPREALHWHGLKKDGA